MKKLHKFAESKIVYTRIESTQGLDGSLGCTERDQTLWKKEYYIRCIIIKHCRVFDYILHHFHTKLIILDYLDSLNKNQQLIMVADIIVSYMFDVNHDINMLNSNSITIGFDIDLTHIPQIKKALENSKHDQEFGMLMQRRKQDMKLCLSNRGKQINSFLCDVRIV